MEFKYTILPNETMDSLLYVEYSSDNDSLVNQIVSIYLADELLRLPKNEKLLEIRKQIIASAPLDVWQQAINNSANNSWDFDELMGLEDTITAAEVEEFYNPSLGETKL